MQPQTELALSCSWMSARSAAGPCTLKLQAELLMLQAMRSEIFKNGPISCSVATPDDFTCGAACSCFAGTPCALC